MPSRSRFATGSLVAVSLLAAGCLSGAVDGQARRDDVRDTVEVMYPDTGDLGEDFQDEIRTWARQNQVDVEFSRTSSVNELITIRAQGNDAPDVALFPQPAVLRQFAERDQLLDLSDVVDQADRDAMMQNLLDVGRVGDGLYGVPVSVNVKSIVFYPKTVGDRAGLGEPPATFEDLRALTDRIARTGTTPWCFGTESEEAAGWPATDWVENLMLVNYGSAAYDQWVDHDIPFDDPRVAAVLEQLESLLLGEGRTHGGRESVTSTGIDAAAAPMLDNPPGCYLYRQGDFLARAGGFLDDVLDDVDSRVGVFPVPGVSPDDRPVLGGGALAGVFNEHNEAAKKLVRFLASPAFGTNGLGESGTWISPRTDFDRTLYPTETWRTIAGIAYESTQFVFDGSEQMPREVGAGLFGRELNAWISGEIDGQAVLDDIEASWPT